MLSMGCLSNVHIEDKFEIIFATNCPAVDIGYTDSPVSWEKQNKVLCWSFINKKLRKHNVR